MKKKHADGADKEILYTRTIRTGSRIYYLDVKRNAKDELFIAVTESKKLHSKDNSQVTFERHKIFLYRDDFDKFMHGMDDVIDFIYNYNFEVSQLKDRHAEVEMSADMPNDTDDGIGDGGIKLNIEF